MQFWKKPYQRPQKMAAIWTHDILTMTAKPPTRGFGGRIYFYNDKSQAIPVDGELIVHGYQEVPGQPIDPAKTKADKTFMFTAEQFTSHFSSSELGASYSVWIPWDAADGMQMEITLIPAFKGTDGSLVQGDPAKLILPGRTKEEPNRTTPFQQVSFQQSETPTADGPLPVMGGMKTTTIARPTQINKLAKKPTRNAETDNTIAYNSQRNNSFTTEVHYGNAPAPTAGNDQPTRSYSLYPEQPQVGFNGAQNVQLNYPQVNLPQGYSPNGHTGITPATVPNPQLQNNRFTTGQFTNGQLPNAQSQNVQLPSGQLPSGQLPSGQLPNIQYGSPNFQNNSVKPTTPTTPARPATPAVPGTGITNPMTPGFADFNPVQPAAVASAFATQWQPFGQPPIPLIQHQPQTNSQVQQAGYTQ